jgi:uncharacterized protein
MQKLSRRKFIIKTSLLSAATFLGANAFSRSFAAAFSAGSDNNEEKALYEKPQVSIIIDDVGYNSARVLPFLELGVPITFSVLPRIMYSQRLAEKIHLKGHEVMLHQPMEPRNPSVNPGPGALYISQNSKERHKIIEDNISSFPFAVGVNNHMGSLFTESREKVNETLKVFKERQFFFVDSVTTSNSVAYNTAKNLNMPSTFRDVFIDPDTDETLIADQLNKLKNIALKYGRAIGIGHPRPETLCALEKFLDENHDSGISFVYTSKLIPEYCTGYRSRSR